MEESLRSGSVPLGIAELPQLPSLTHVRRMQLAAERGREAGLAPLGLLLMPGTGGARGVETRWHMAQAHRGEKKRWTLPRRYARNQPPANWRIIRSAGQAGLNAERCNP